MTGPGRLLRPRRDSDLPALVQVLRAVYEADRYPTVWPDEPHAFVATAAPLAAWVAEVNGAPVGQVLLCAVSPGSDWGTAPGAALVEVKRLFVAPSARGQGLAQRLMHTALTEAARRNLQAVLQTHEDNHAAIRMYERSGWTRVGSVQAGWTDAEGRHPTMVLFTAPRRL